MSETKPTRSKRVYEIEVMKAIAIIAMVFVHVFEMSVNLNISSFAEDAAGSIIEFFGCIPSAGVFMFAMGWGASYSKRATAETYVKRALSLFVLGIVINIFEQYLPSILAPDTYGALSDKLPSILATDIYFFAALMSLYFALLKVLKNNRLQVIVSAVVLLACFLINGLVGFESFTTGNEWLDTILGLFIRVNDYSYFPFISWFVYPILGYGLAALFRKYGMEKALVFAAVTGIAALALSDLLIRLDAMPDALVLDVLTTRDGVYYALHPIYALGGYGIIAIEFVLVHLALTISKNQIPDFMLTMSKNVSQIYVSQWALIGVLSPLLAVVTSVWVNILIAICILFASYYCGKVLKEKNIIKV